MTFLKPGTLCITIGSRGGNNGTLVRVLAYTGAHPDSPAVKEGYLIQTVSGLPFRTALRRIDGEWKVRHHAENTCTADRSKLKPLFDAPSANAYKRTRSTPASSRAPALSSCLAMSSKK